MITLTDKQLKHWCITKKELKDIVKKVKTKCHMCGGYIDKSLKRYLTRGNACIKCINHINDKLKGK